MYIDCLWVAGSFKGHGYASELLNFCIEDSKRKGKKGIQSGYRLLRSTNLLPDTA